MPHENVNCLRLPALFSPPIGLARRLVILGLLVCGLGGSETPAPGEESDAGYVSLFNGKDLDGWQLRGKSKKGYVVENGCLVCPADGGGYLFSAKEYADFSLRLEFKLTPGANNGVAIRTPLVDARPAFEGMEIQVLDDPAFEGKCRPNQFHGSLYDVLPAKRGFLRPLGQWNEQEIVCRGRHITVHLNGHAILDAHLDQVKDAELLKQHPGLQRTRGHVGFLGHGSRVEFRNIRIKEFVAGTWKAGAAKLTITPPKPMWMSGYGNRTKRADGVEHDLWAKALLLEDPAGQRAVLVTLDLVGIDRPTSRGVCRTLEKRYGLRRAQLALNCSHTHCGPAVGRNLHGMFFFDETEWRRIDDYTAWLQDRIVTVVGEALAKRMPCTLHWGLGRADFAVNRRSNKHEEVVLLRKQGRLKGPNDFNVPVLKVTTTPQPLSPTEGVLAIVFGYACHPTKLTDFYRWCGDYAGFAQLDLEKAHPGAVALFCQGCGGDQVPWPRADGDVKQTAAVGRQLADAVDRVLARAMTQVQGDLATRYAEVELKLANLAEQKELQTLAAGTNPYEARRAKQVLEQIKAGRPPASAYPYPVQVWKIGSELLFVTLGGEVVVDYALRLQAELGVKRTWVAGYTNDVMAYIPSRRVLLEGGYEGGRAMVYYGLPTVWSPQVEETIVRQVHALTSTPLLKPRGESSSLGGSDSPAAGDSVDLFNGKDLTGWVNVNGAPATWSVRDGVLVGAGKPSGFLRTEKMYENYVLELEWRITQAKGNSGLFLHADALPQVGAPYPRAVEVQIHDGDHGSIFGIRGAKVAPLTNPAKGHGGEAQPLEQRCRPVGQWNRYVVTSKNGALDLEVNGKLVTRVKGCSQRKGYIALQSETGEVQFRNVRITPLAGSNPPAGQVAQADQGLRSLFDGVSFNGWQYRDEFKGHWVIRDGILAATGKPYAKRPAQRDLWTRNDYRDFVMVVDWRLLRKPELRALPVFTPDGLYALDAAGKLLLKKIPDAGDSGVYLRGSDRSQVNIWSQPMGSGDINDYHKDTKLAADIRRACVPKKKADAPFGQWNRFVITMQGDRVTVVLNGETVIERAQLPGVPASGPLGLQEHNDPVEFRNLFLKTLK